jgi:hypothetical protein
MHSSHRLRALVACALAAGSALACGDAPAAAVTAVTADRAAAASLHGHWLPPAMALQPQGSTRGALTFAPNGRYVSATTSFGVYPGQAPNAVSGWTQVAGRYQVTGDRIAFRPDTLTTWDSVFGNRTPTVTTPYPYGGMFDDCVFELRGDTLVLYFTTYPADAPVRARATYRRGPAGTTG